MFTVGRFPQRQTKYPTDYYSSIIPLALPLRPVYERRVILSTILGALAGLSLVLNLWQWAVGRRFPLHERSADPAFSPAVALLKPLKGCDSATAECLRSWLKQDYAGHVQVLFGVADAHDPVCGLVRKLLQEFPAVDAQLVICGAPVCTNAKVSTLIQLEKLAAHELLIISDADVRPPSDLLANIVQPLRQPDVGLVNCFYELANVVTPAMRCEAVAVNSDFWSQVLQSQSIKANDFALGAVMAVRRSSLEEIGGFAALANCLADDYQLGNRIARSGKRIALTPVVVQCWSDPLGWREVWNHQLRWARTIRVCQPLPYFFSILSNATLWPLLWLGAHPTPRVLGFALGCWVVRVLAAYDLQRLLTRARVPLAQAAAALPKDLVQVFVWLLAFAGNRIEWRGQRLLLRKDGTLVPVPQ